MIAIFNRCSPIAPARADHIFGVSCMSGESNSKAGESLLIKKFPHPAHFLGRASESMNKQHARAAAGEKEGFSCRNDLRFHGLIISIKPRRPSS